MRDIFFYVGRTRSEALGNGVYFSYEEAIDVQTNANLRASDVGKMAWSLFEVTITLNDLVKV